MKIKWNLFWEIFISFLIVINITILSFNSNYFHLDYLAENMLPILIKIFFIIVITFFISFYISSNLSKTYFILKKSIKQLKNSNIRSRVFVDKDYIFYDLISDLNDFKDIIDNKLKFIKQNISSIKETLDQEELEKIEDKIEEIENMYEEVEN